MRSLVLSSLLGLGALGLSLGTPAPARADNLGGAAFTNGTTPVAYYGRGYYGRGRAFYPGYGYGYGYNRSYYPYGGYGAYGGYGLYSGYGAYGGYGGYYPRINRSYYPYGGYGGYYRPYSRYYSRPGFVW